MTPLRIETIGLHTQEAAKAVVLAGLAERFDSMDHALNPDLNAIVQTYTENGEVFLVGRYQHEVVCTGALIQESPNIGRIVRMSVLKAYRRRGFARLMLSELEQAAKSKGFSRIVLETTNLGMMQSGFT